MSSFAHQPGQARRQLSLFRIQRLHRSAVEDPALDRAALQHGAFMRFELVEASGEQRLNRRRNGHRPVAGLLKERNHLLDEERVTLGSLPYAGAQSPVQVRQALDQALGLLGRKRLEQHRGRVDLAAAPACSAVEQIRPRHAEQQDGRIARKIGHVLDQVEKGLLTPVQVVEDTDERSLRGNHLQVLPKGPGDLLAGGDQLLIAEEGADRLCGDRVGLRLGQLPHDLHDRPVGDALAVRETAATHDERVLE